MPTSVGRAVLSLLPQFQLRYAVSRDPAARTGRSPLLVCLHPGWSGVAPPPYYGEGFLSSIFLPAFAGTRAILACPDCPSGAWNNDTSRRAVIDLIDHLVAESGADRDRVSLAGYSAGGWGVWDLLRHAGPRFASALVFAATPVIDPVDAFERNFTEAHDVLTGRLAEWIGGIPDIPLTIIHSQDDELLPWEQVRTAYEALQRARPRVELHLVHGVGHFESEGYVPALASSCAWLVETWNPPDR